MPTTRRPSLGHVLAAAGIAALAVAGSAAPHATRAAAHQTWPPFALVTGLLVIGLVAHRDGLFARLARRSPGGGPGPGWCSCASWR